MPVFSDLLGAHIADEPILSAYRGSDLIVPGRRNDAINPSFEAVSGTVEVRRNLAIDPRGTASTTWSSNEPVITLSAGPAFAGSATSRRFTRAATGTGRVAIVVGTSFVASTKFSLKMTVQASEALSNVAVNYRPDSLTSTAQTTVATVSIPAGVSEINVTGTTSATAPTATAGVALIYSSGSVGSALDITNVLIERALAAGGYFDGDTPAAGDYTYAWTGTANASASRMNGTALAGVTSTRVASVSSTEWANSGSRSLRQVPNSSTSADSYSEPIQNIASVLKPNTTYTLGAKVRLTAPLTDGLAGGSRSLFVYLNGTSIVGSTTPGAQAPNVAGVHELRVTFTTPASLSGYNSIRLYHGGLVGSGDLWWDDVMLVEVPSEAEPYTGPYRDGDSPGWGWLGAPHASISVGWN